MKMKDMGDPRRRKPVMVAALLLAVLSLSAFSCNSFEKNMWRALNVAKAEYETLQSHMANRRITEDITQEQWDTFALRGNAYIVLHNRAADAMSAYQAVKKAGADKDLEALQAEALNLSVQITAAIKDLRALIASFGRQPPPPTKQFIKALEKVGIDYDAVPAAGGVTP